MLIATLFSRVARFVAPSISKSFGGHHKDVASDPHPLLTYRRCRSRDLDQPMWPSVRLPLKPEKGTEPQQNTPKYAVSKEGQPIAVLEGNQKQASHLEEMCLHF